MKKIVLAALLSASAAPAVAADFYAGANLGFTNYGYSNVTNNSQAGGSIFGGFQFSQLFSVEVEYANLGGFDTISRQYKGNSFGVKGVGTFPLNEKFALIGKAGIVNTSISATPQPGWILGGATSFSNTGLTLGFAGQYNVTPKFGVRAGIDIYPIGDATISTTTARLVSIGGVVKF